MLLEEIFGGPPQAKAKWAITWDNAFPDSDSTKLITALNKLGSLTKPETKTTVILIPNSNVSEKEILDVIKSNLDSKKGNVFCVRYTVGKAYQLGAKTNHKWQRANSGE